MAKRQEPEEHENHERWLVSYADFMTLLFAFFVVMYSTSRVDQKRMVDVVKSIKFAMHFKGTGGSDQLPLFEGPLNESGCVGNISDQPSRQEMEAVEAVRRRLENRLKGILQDRTDGLRTVLLHVEGRRIMIRLSAAHFFDASQAAIRPEVIPILDSIATELASFKRPIRVEGHTDDLPPSRSRFRDNWDLSSSRAAAVASYIQSAGFIDGRSLSAAGYAATRPMVPNDSAANRELNRRIEMVVEVKAGDAHDMIAR